MIYFPFDITLFRSECLGYDQTKIHFLKFKNIFMNRMYSVNHFFMFLYGYFYENS